MKRALSAVGLLAFCLTWVASAAAQASDHLKCYKIKDPQLKATYTAELDGLTPEPGCVIKVPAKLACVPATKTNVSPAPPGTGGTGTPNAFGCYKIKCPKATLPLLQLNDQFGNRSVTPTGARLLCAPVAPATTTTTSTTTSTTSTTTRTAFPPCPALNDSCGTCGTGVCISGCRCDSTQCANTCSLICVNISTGVQEACTTDAQCASGSACVGTFCTDCGTGNGRNACIAPCP